MTVPHDGPEPHRELVPNRRGEGKVQYEDLVHEAGSGSARGIGGMASLARKLHYDTDQPKEGGNALREKRGPDFLGYYR